MRSGANATLVLSSLVFEYSCDAMVLLDSDLIVRALNPAAQGMLGWRGEDLAAGLDCRSVVGCRRFVLPPGPDAVAPGACLCDHVKTLHRAVAQARLHVWPRGRRGMTVSASCSPVPVDHLGGAVLILRPADTDDVPVGGELRGGSLRLDVTRHRVYADGRLVHLTPIEFDLLRYLLANRETVVSRQGLLEHVWRYHDVDDRDLIKSHIGSLRHRLRDAGVDDVRIENVYGVGYMLTVPDDACRLDNAPSPGTAGDWW